MPDVFFTWDSLATLASSSLLCFLIVSYTKRFVDPIWKAGTDFYAVCVGTIIVLVTSAAQGESFTAANVLLAVFNGFLVAATAGKLNDKVLKEREHKDNQGAV